MHEGKPSQTALRVATHRAAHQLLDRPKVLDDPVALDMLGPERAQALRADPRSSETSVIARYMRAFVAARSRLAEDELGRAMERGVGQYVVLGAGLDTFALRNPHPPEALKIFEVDFPATQAWKWELMAQAGLAAPDSLTYVPLDFHRQTLAQGLERAGHDATRPSFFSWLGVAPYLVPEAVRATLGFIASCPKGSGVVFDYMIDPKGMSLWERLLLKGIGAVTKASGEPLRSHFEPAALAGELDALGFSQTRDLDQAAINGLYFSGREDGLGVGRMSHIMVGWV
ncbi:MAG: class I SAM-dependent methyltransferase [Desulfarculus sp.]|nr:class I SAM-dependent methyltransferase [Pseudomonadota bacterium]MBV1714978.1 class I SAM-dependent methyltransferase [Desulfarculus sp.]MBU4573902.1 class I SAM-dependent methyltransferase [Pseudomonadota bacterium]MBU4598969.1 class I SAM-dependent methyltransferase [Pseudomonadota bacterium]MBV1737478.1 class I SAM-dependent methyltransferase [Desulfarculus sp.]